MLIRTVRLKLFKPGNKEAVVRRVVAPRGRHFTNASIENIVADFAEKVEAAMPDRYRVVQTGPGDFNFVRTDQYVPAKP